MHPFDYPEIVKLFRELFDRIFEESGRGALLIATAHIDDHLTKLLKEILPPDISKSNREKLFRYPGPLSSFSSKIELSYSFRLINKNLYNSLNALRKLRNDAAHSSEKFDLNELNDRMKHFYDLGPDIPNFIKNISKEMLVQSKLIDIESIEDWDKLTEEEKKKLIENITRDEKIMNSLEKQVPHWELLNGLCLICAIIVDKREKISKLKDKMTTWDDLLESKL